MRIKNINWGKIYLSFLLIIIFTDTQSQEFIPLWPKGKMLNSKGTAISDSIFDERYRRVGTPGIFAFFPSKQENKGAAVLICPGGGYKHLSYVSSGTQIAKWFNTMGINAFVLISRLPHSTDLVDPAKAPLQDAQRAIRIIRANATIWNINPHKIGVMGFSAGGHVASTLGTHVENVSSIGDMMDTISFIPDFMLLVSPVITMGQYTHSGSRDNLLGKTPSQELIQKYSNELQVTDKTPPTFLVHAENDASVSVKNSFIFYQALREKNISCSLHIFPQGGHAIGLQENPGSTCLWTSLCELWLKEMGFNN